MAGIRPQRGGALTSTGIALIVVVVVCVASLIALVILYTGQTKLDQDREAAIKDFEKVANRGEFAQYQSLACARPDRARSHGRGTPRHGQVDHWLGRRRPELRPAADPGQVPGDRRRQAHRQRRRLQARGPAAPAHRRQQSSPIRSPRSATAASRPTRTSRHARAQITELTQARDEAKQQFDEQVAVIEGKLKDTADQLADYQKAKDAESRDPEDQCHQGGRSSSARTRPPPRRTRGAGQEPHQDAQPPQ